MMEIQPLNPRQIERFIKHYYRDVPERQQFQRELQRRRELCELARVPALLGFILQMWRKRGAVTGDKLELYEQITLELARHLDTDKEGVQPDRKWLVEDNDGSLKLDLLRQLAFNQLFKGFIRPPYDIGGTDDDISRLSFTSEQLRAEAAAFARTIDEREGLTINPRNLAEDVKATALLRQVGADHYAFAHLTLQEYLAAWQLAIRHDADTCERIFCRAYFNPMLAEMEVLPMTLGLVNEPDKFYEALERLPESLNFKGLRVRIRGLGYAASLGQRVFASLKERLVKFLFAPWNGEPPHWEIVIRSFPPMAATFSEPIIKRIAQQLKDEASLRRLIAVKVLSQIGGEAVIDALLMALQDEHSGVRQAAVEALAQSSSSHVVEALIAALHDEAEIVRLKVVESLGEIGNERAVIALLKVFVGEDRWAKARLPEALGKISSDAIIAFLVNALRHADRNIRIIAIKSLAEIGNETAINALVSALQDEDHSVRFWAAMKLGRLGFNEAVNILLDSTLHPNITIRRLAIGALGEIREQRATEALLNALQDEDEFIRMRAAGSLGELGGDEAKETLLNILQDTASKLRRRAITALSKLGGRNVAEFLRLAMKDRDAFIRIKAAEMLRYQNEKESFEVLLNELCDEDGATRGLAVTAMRRFTGRGLVLMLLKALNDKNLDVSKKAAIVLEEIGSDDLSENLFKALSDEDRFVRRKAAETIGYYSISVKPISQELARLSIVDSMNEVGNAAKQAKQQFYLKLQYFSPPVSITKTHSRPQSCPSPSLTAHARAELEPRIAAKYREVLRGGDARQKGKALEELLAAIFASIPGFTVTERNYRTTTEEIDLVVRNASADPFWHGWGNLILVEAKHWRAQRVGKNEYVQFYRKMENRGGHCTLGFLICTERFAETVEKEMLRDSKFPLRVAPIDGEDLQRLVESQDRSEILRGFVERALLT
jgi:HEAT repeat protein